MRLRQQAALGWKVEEEDTDRHVAVDDRHAEGAHDASAVEPDPLGPGRGLGREPPELAAGERVLDRRPRGARRRRARARELAKGAAERAREARSLPASSVGDRLEVEGAMVEDRSVEELERAGGVVVGLHRHQGEAELDRALAAGRERDVGYLAARGEPRR